MHSGSHDKKAYLKKKTRNAKNTATTLKILTENSKKYFTQIRLFNMRGHFFVKKAYLKKNTKC